MNIRYLAPADTDAAAVAVELHAKMAKEPDLAPRSLSEVRQLVATDGAYLVTDDGDIVSFLFATPLGASFVEIHSLYTDPMFRRHGHMRALVAHVQAKVGGHLLAATFHRRTLEVLAPLGFVSTRLSQIPLIARITFVRKRLKPHRILSIIAFASRSRPMYLVS